MIRSNGADYGAALLSGGGRIAETGPVAVRGNELELQARWFAGEFGRDHVTTEGESVHIEDFGRWNHEAGPDFIDARLRLGSEQRRGSIELDLDVRDWERHGHAVNPAFRDTALHLFFTRAAPRFFTRTCEHRNVPQVQLLQSSSPRATAKGTPDLITSRPDEAVKILRAAARHRLASKAVERARYAAVHGEDAAWFAAFAGALGYKRNQMPFSLIAQRVPLREAREAMLFGVAGFLESPEPPAAGREVRGYLRGLWEDWWSVRTRCERWILLPTAWQWSGLRPANHPHRRVAALAGLVREWRGIRAAIDQTDSRTLAAVLGHIKHPFWDDRFNLAAARMARPQALIGAERIRDILLNLHFPWVVSRDESASAKFLTARGPTPAATMRLAAERFFGGLPAPLLRLAAVQQGLLQLDRDHRTAPDPEAFLEALRRMSAD